MASCQVESFANSRVWMLTLKISPEIFNWILHLFNHKQSYKYRHRNQS